MFNRATKKHLLSAWKNLSSSATNDNIEEFAVPERFAIFVPSDDGEWLIGSSGFAHQQKRL